MLLRLLKSILRPRAPAAAGAEAQRAALQAETRGIRPPAGVKNPELYSRLASLASGRSVQVPGVQRDSAPSRGEAGGDAEGLAPDYDPVREMITHAAGLRREQLAPALEARVNAHAEAFSAVARPARGINVFVYHVDMPQDVVLNYVDVKLHPGHFDYLDILRRFVERIRRHCPGAMVYLATAGGARHGALAADDVAVAELELDATRPMYERATALLGYLRSAAFARDTVFLDADALVNRPLDDVFELGFDVGLTYRELVRLMPVNEGVIFLCARRPERVRRFFETRLATYDALAVDARITGFYGDIKRWRGGQLSLNALAQDLRPYSPYRLDETAGARLRFLPCDTFNFAGGEGEAASASERLDERFVVHFKGMRKYAFVYAAEAERAARRDA